jgi:hypothetical protein
MLHVSISASYELLRLERLEKIMSRKLRLVENLVLVLSGLFGGGKEKRKRERRQS